MLKHSADYLLVGAGAVGMAFLDTLVTETDATVVVVDRGDQPGGHWNAVYPFVRLHQPSAYYGVNSRELSSGRVDATGWNAGLFELASADEIRAYFDAVMRALVATGRVQYFPASDYLGGADGIHRFAGLSGETHTVTVRRRLVDSTHSGVVVPSMRPPGYDVAPGVSCVPPNRLPRDAAGHDRYVVVGAGKTAMDSLLWLLRHGVPTDRLTWIKPRESWLLDRMNIQPGAEFAAALRTSFAVRLDAVMNATSLPDLYDRLEAGGALLRIDPTRQPTMYRCATVTRAEVDALRTVTDVVRLGHVTGIDGDGVTLQRGRHDVAGSPLYVDCTAEGLRGGPITDIFAGDRITLQCVRSCQQIFSAAFIAHVEAAYSDDAARNELCSPVPLPYNTLDWVTMTLLEQRNQLRWLAEPALMDWLHASRLNVLHEVFAPVMERPAVREKAFGAVAVGLRAADAKLVALAGEAGLTEVGLQTIGTGS